MKNEKRIWLTTDTHFNHKKLVEYGRPEFFEDMIENNLKYLVQEGDMLIHLGDICIGNDEEMHEKYIKPIKAEKILVRGNHDKKSSTWYLEHGWNFVCDSFSVKTHGYNILFTHEPREKFHGHNLNIHGHFHDDDHRKHSSAEFYNEHFHKLLALEYEEYRPVLLKSFLDRFKKK